MSSHDFHKSKYLRVLLASVIIIATLFNILDVTLKDALDISDPNSMWVSIIAGGANFSTFVFPNQLYFLSLTIFDPIVSIIAVALLSVCTVISIHYFSRQVSTRRILLIYLIISAILSSALFVL